MTEEEVLSLVRGVVESEGWPWEEPVTVRRYRMWPIFGRVRWHVMTNANRRGANVSVHVDDVTAAVMAKAFAPR